MTRSKTGRCAAAAALLIFFAVPSIAGARDVPDALRESVRQGASSIVLRTKPASIALLRNALPGSPGPYLRARLNGHGPFLFVFDTGATVTILDTDVVRRAGIPIVFHREHNSIVKIRDLDLGGVSLRDAYAFTNPGLRAGVGVDGVLGFNAFGTMPFQLDGSTLTVFDHLPDVSRATRVPLLVDHSGWRIVAVPMIPLATETTTISVLIDTGDDGWIDLLPDDARAVPLRKNLRAAHVEYNPVTGTTRTMMGQAAGPFSLAGATIDSPVFRTDPDLPVSDVGWRLLEQLLPIVFDRGHRAVYITSANRHPVANAMHTFPFRVTFRGGVARVSDVLPGVSPVPDLAVGDRLDAIGDRAAASYDANSLEELLEHSSSLRVSWVHDGATIIREIPVLTLP